MSLLKMYNLEMDSFEFYIHLLVSDEGEISELKLIALRGHARLAPVLLGGLSRITTKALQSGIHPLEIAKLYREEEVKSLFIVKGHDYIEKASSVTDLIGRIIEVAYTDCDKKLQARNYGLLEEGVNNNV